MFAVVRSARVTFWLGLALFGYYFLVSDVVRRSLGGDTTNVWLIFLAMLLLYGLWTRSPLVAMVVTGTITFLWVVGASFRPGTTPDIDPRRLGWTMYHALAPPLMVGVGAFARAVIFRRPRHEAPTSEAPARDR